MDNIQEKTMCVDIHDCDQILFGPKATSPHQSAYRNSSIFHKKQHIISKERLTQSRDPK